MRILIVRLRAIGDLIHAMPAACAIKDQLRGAFVAWLAEDWAGELLRDHPAIDQCISVPRRWNRSPRQILRLKHELRSFRFDAVLDLQGIGSSVLASLLSGAPRRFGFMGMVGHQLRNVIPSEKFQRSLSHGIARALHFEMIQPSSRHIVPRYLEILRPLGINQPAVRFGLVEAEDAACFAERVLRETHLSSGTYAALYPSGRPWKTWPAGRFAEVAEYLRDAHSLPSLVIPSGDLEDRSASEIAALAGRGVNSAPPMNLRQMAALARRSRLFIAGDTGPLHLAAAVGAPCIGLIGHALADRFRPWGENNIVVKGAPIPLDRARQDGLGEAAMREIPVDQVCRAADRLLG